MYSTPKNTKELIPENEFYQNAYYFDKGIVSFKETWVDTLINKDIYCLDELSIEHGAEIHGDIVCKNCFIKGKVYGSVYTWGQLIVAEGAFVNGNITSCMIKIAQGAIINGSINMQSGITVPEYLSHIKKPDLQKYSVNDPVKSLLVDEKEAPALPVREEVPAAHPILQKNTPDTKKTTSSRSSESGGNDSHWW